MGCVEMNYDPSVQCNRVSVGLGSPNLTDESPRLIVPEADFVRASSEARGVLAGQTGKEHLWRPGDVRAVSTARTSPRDLTFSVGKSVPSVEPEYFCCYDSEPKHNAWPLNKMRASLLAATARGERKVSQQALAMAQAHWQMSESAITAGILHGSSTIDEEKRSTMHAKALVWLTSASFAGRRINLVEIDDVCDGGEALNDALRKRAGTNVMK
jgi:hypothetical protein